jgi:hypothetical protein
MVRFSRSAGDGHAQEKGCLAQVSGVKDVHEPLLDLGSRSRTTCGRDEVVHVGEDGGQLASRPADE